MLAARAIRLGRLWVATVIALLGLIGHDFDDEPVALIFFFLE